MLNRTLLLCMTPGISLRLWETNGLIRREMRLYERYLAAGWQVTILTYDDPQSLPRLPVGMHAYCIRSMGRLDPVLLWRLRAAMQRAHVIKTNQATGCLRYTVAAALAGRPILVRCGWLPGRNLAIRHVPGPYLAMVRLTERVGFHLADAVEVATEGDRHFTARTYGVPQGKVHLWPNWIDTAHFHPMDVPRVPRSVAFVGRLDAVKRVDLLMQACARAGIEELNLIGDGPARRQLELLAQDLRLHVVFWGHQCQADLPRIVQQSAVFALTSQTEGHPKALLEAMSCGMACIGTDVPGINEVIHHGEDGLLAESDPAALAAAIRRLLHDTDLAKRLSAKARRYVVENCDFEVLFDRERRLLEAMCGRSR